MALTIYKPGQGYWTRVLSAVGFAVLILSGVAFIWNQLELLGSTDARSVPSSNLVAGLAKYGSEAKQPVATIAAISEVRLDTTAAPQIVIKDNTQKQTFNLPLGQFIKVFEPLVTVHSSKSALNFGESDAVSAVLNQQQVTLTYNSFANRNRIYIQSIIAVVILLGAGLGGFSVMNRPNVVDFFIATEGEMRKVNWPSRPELIGATWLVICGTFLLAISITVVDLGFLEFFKKIKVIQTEDEIKP